MMGMSRPRLPLNTELPYHITIRCVHREHFPVPINMAWEIFEKHLFFVHHGFGIKIHSFVLMPNHTHMIARAPQGNLSQAMRYLARETSMDFIRISGRVNQNYGQRYHRSLIDSHHYFLQAYKYVYQNPVRAHLSERVEEYPYSTLQLLLGQKKFMIPMENDEILFETDDFHSSLEWLNRRSDPSDIDAIRKALRRRVFTIPRDRISRDPHRLENELL